MIPDVKYTYRSVRLFYEKVVKKMISTFPFNYTILQDLLFLNQENRCKLSSDCVVNLSKIFPSILPANDENHTKLVDELTDS
ncbi:uncharacterized protein LOC144619507 isoform X2 [Crassostrea virginica]